MPWLLLHASDDPTLRGPIGPKIGAPDAFESAQYDNPSNGAPFLCTSAFGGKRTDREMVERWYSVVCKSRKTS